MAGLVLGTLDILNTRHAVVVPAGSEGVVVSVRAAGGVEYCGSLLVLGSSGERPVTDKPALAGAGTEAEEGYAVTSPIDGIFYNRPTPEEPPFVTEGDRVGSGQTLGLIEVMKTFNPVRLEGPGAPEAGTVVSVAVSGRQEVAAGDLLFVIQPD